MKTNTTIDFKWNTKKLETLQNRNTIFMWLSAISALVILAIAIYSENKLLAFGVILASAIIYSLKKVEPKTFPVEVSEKGIRVYNRLFKYKKILHFWMLTHNEKNYLLFISKQQVIFLTNVILIEPQINIEDLKNYFLKFIEEKEIDASFIDMIFE